MTGPLLLHRQPELERSPLSQVPEAMPPLDGRAEPSVRDHIWELSPNLHCSVVGTCLTTGELRQLFAKLDEPDARTASDHALHSRAVRIAGQRELGGKLLNKLLDKKHETHVRRFAKARTAADVRRLWDEALERGEIPGAYWAVLTHPATDRELVQHVFGEVHMLSHLVGMSNRVDIDRLRQLETALGERDEKIARQEQRLQRAAAEKAELAQRLCDLEAQLRQRVPIAPALPAEGETEGLRRRLADEQARAAQFATRCDELVRDLRAERDALERHEAKVADLQAEIAALESALGAEAKPEKPDVAADLAGRTLLYVGGRPKLIEQLKVVTARRGGQLLSHDGGVEDNASLLPGLVSQSDAAFFPVDCISHHAADQVKRLCRQMTKPFVPLRSASLASFIGALGQPLSSPARPS